MTVSALISESDWLRLLAAWARERTMLTMSEKYLGDPDGFDSEKSIHRKEYKND